MHSELAKLVHLQEVEHEILALTTQMGGYRLRVAAREAALADTGRQLEENTKALTNESAARRRMESDIDDLRQKSQRYRAQLETVQSDSAMKALEHQIAFCKQEIDRLEEAEFSSLVQTETLDENHRKLHETLANLRLALDAENTDAQHGLGRDQAKQAELARERDSVRQDADASLLTEYDRISAAHKPAVAQVEGQRCSACQMMVRPQRWNEIRQGGVHFCESCGRLLYYNPAIDLSDAAHLPPAAKKPSGPARDTAHGRKQDRSPSQSTATGSEHPGRED